MQKLPLLAGFFQGAASLLIESFKRYPLEVMLCPLPGKMITATRASNPNEIPGVNRKGIVGKDQRESAKITMLCPDGWAKNINGRPEVKDLYVLVRMPLGLIKKIEEEVKLELIAAAEAESANESPNGNG